MTEKDQQIFDDYMVEMIAHDKAIIDYNKIVFKDLRKQLGQKYINDIDECLRECEAHGKLEIVDRPDIKPQMEDWRSFDHILIDQYENGGYDGDSFAGWVYIPIGKKYLKSHYAM